VENIYSSSMKQSTEKRPKLRPKHTRLDYALEAVAMVGIIIIWLLPAIMWRDLPEIIPTHIGINGQADDWGSRRTIFLLPAITTVLLAGLGILNRYPHIFNYPVKVTDANAERLYQKATLVIRILKVVIASMFIIIEWQICRVNGNNPSAFPVWFIPVIIVIPVFLPIILAFTLTGKMSNKKE